MKFFIDAQLPKGITEVFIELGHQASHARDLPHGNATKDEEILDILEVDVVIVSKDSDFYKSSLIHGRPVKLVYVKVPNQSRRLLIELFRRSSPKIVELLGQYDVLQLEPKTIVGII